MAARNDPDPIFVDLSADASENGPTRIESMCPRCEENGTTTLLFTRIPHFREVVVMAFECPHCNERNNELQMASVIQERGCRYSLAVPAGAVHLLNRQVVKSNSATVTVPELELEIPPGTQEGSLSTVEGILAKAGDGLRALQSERRAAAPELADALDAFLARLADCQAGRCAFTLTVDDPAGNSFVECDVVGPLADPQLTMDHYHRTPGQSSALGLAVADGDDDSAQQPPPGGPSPRVPSEFVDTAEAVHHGWKPVGAAAARRAMASLDGAAAVAALAKYAAPDEVMVFPGTCMACDGGVQVRMLTLDVPFFKEVIVMSSACDACGYRSAELKPGGAIAALGRTLSVAVRGPGDLLRDVIKSDSASVRVPELELELSVGTLGGMVTTVEGLIRQVESALRRMHSVSLGDASPADARSTWRTFFAKLDKFATGVEPWTLELHDPLANSFISSPSADPRADPQLVITEFTRSYDEDEEWGLNDIDVTTGLTLDAIAEGGA